jgi:Arm DNA-binding domain
MTQAPKITALRLGKLTKPGRYPVGEGVYLQVTGEAGRSWVFRYERHKRAHWMGLGPCALITLAEARQKGRDARRLLLDGVDPLAERKRKRAQAGTDAAKAPSDTFQRMRRAGEMPSTVRNGPRR